MRKLLLIMAFSLVSASVTGSESDFPGVQELMSEEEFKAAGLDKLSPEERRALDGWLLQYTATEAPEMLISSEEVKEVEAQHVIQANVKQPFTGWEGNTVFYLDNGQVWRQRLDGRVTYNGDDTAVEIKKNFFGFYKLHHLDSDRSVGVSRIQ